MSVPGIYYTAVVLVRVYMFHIFLVYQSLALFHKIFRRKNARRAQVSGQVVDSSECVQLLNMNNNFYNIQQKKKQSTSIYQPESRRIPQVTLQKGGRDPRLAHCCVGVKKILAGGVEQCM